MGFDACLMQMMEVGYELKDTAKYMTGSEETEPATGWNYESTLNNLVQIPGMNGDQLGAKFVNYFSGNGITLSTVDLSEFNYLAAVLSDLGYALIKPEIKDYIQQACQQVEKFADPDFVDLYHLAQLFETTIPDNEVKNRALAVMYEVYNVVTSEKHDYINHDAHKLSIYVPKYSYDPNYNDLLISEDTMWNEFLTWYHGGASGAPTKPVITGPTKGGANVEHTFTFHSMDPEGDDILYCVEWRDFTSEEWFGPVDSGQIVEAKRTWVGQGAYTMKAFAEDVKGARSETSYYTVLLPRARLFLTLEKLATQFPILKNILHIFAYKYVT